MYKSFLFIVFLFFTLELYSQVNENTFNILFINSYHSGFSWSDQIESGFLNEISSSNLDIEISYERMDSKRFSLESISLDFVKRLESKYHKRFFDIVVTSDDNAFNFANKYRSQLFPDLPIVFCGVNNINSPLLIKPDRLTGVIEYVDIEALVRLILYVHNNVKHLALIADSTNSGLIHIENTKNLLSDKFSYITYSEHKEWTLDELSSELLLLPDSTVIIDLAFHRDRNGNIISFEDELEFLNNKTTFPAYTLWDSRLGYGVLGGVMTTGNTQGVELGKIVVQLLKGKPIKSFPVKTKIDLPVYFDYLQLRRFNIKESSLPQNAQVVNYPDTFWFKYKKYLLGLILFISFQSTLILLMIFNILKKRTVQNKLNFLNLELESRIDLRTNELSESLKDLKETQFQLVESKKMAALAGMVTGIAHQMNTPLGICITAASIIQDETRHLSHLLKLVESTELLERNLKSISSVVDDFRKVSVDLNVESKEELNLLRYIEDIVSIKKENNVKVSVDCPNNIKLLTYPGSILRIIYIFMENSILHGFKNNSVNTPEIIINVEKKEGVIVLKYSDNGIGLRGVDAERIFDPFYTSTLGKGRSGLGLNIAYNEVVNRLKGKIYIDQSCNTGLGLCIELTNKPL